MEPNAKEKLAAAAYSLLEPFHTITGSGLRGVAVALSHNDVAAIFLRFDVACLAVRVDPDDDTLDLALITAVPEDVADASHLQPWKNYIQREFGWGWIGVNQQGYLDSISFSFGGAVPDISLTALASSIQVAGHIDHSKALHNIRAIAA